MKPDPQLTDSIEPSPEKLLAPFAKGRIAMWIVVAVALHVLLIGGTSLGFIRDKWIDPEGAEARKVAAQAASDALKAKNKPAVAKPLTAANDQCRDAAAPTNAAPAVGQRSQLNGESSKNSDG